MTTMFRQTFLSGLRVPDLLSRVEYSRAKADRLLMSSTVLQRPERPGGHLDAEPAAGGVPEGQLPVAPPAPRQRMACVHTNVWDC